MTVDEAIKKLKKIRRKSIFGGNTCLAICLDESEIETCNVQRIKLDSDHGGAVVLVRGKIGR